MDSGWGDNVGAARRGRSNMLDGNILYMSCGVRAATAGRPYINTIKNHKYHQYPFFE